MAQPAVLTLADMYARCPANTIRGYFDDSNDGSLTDENSMVMDVLASAEGELYSRVARAWPGTLMTDPNSPIRLLILNDPTLRMHLAWIACELASERRIEFTDKDGWGAFRAQYERAIIYIENLSKGILKSPGEAIVGPNGTSGGYVSGTQSGNGWEDPDFVFAPSRYSPGGHGGF